MNAAHEEALQAIRRMVRDWRPVEIQRGPRAWWNPHS
jgi:hypothetical protein